MLFIVVLVCVGATQYDFTPFEENILPFWVDNFSRSKKWDNSGNYTFWGPYEPWPHTLSVYASADVLFARYITNTLDDLSEDDKKKWGENINSFQDAKTGHFYSDPVEATCGYEPWHASSYARAALKLLDVDPKYKNQWVYDVADATEKEWEDVFTPLLDMSDKNITIWITSHKLMAYHSIVLMDEKYDEYKHFFDWWFDFLDKNIDKKTGFWCGTDRKWCPPDHPDPEPIPGKTDAPKVVGMAGSFHMYIIYEYVGRSWLVPENVMNWTMACQGKDGLWDEVKHFSYCVDLDGLFNIIRSSIFAGKHRWDEVKERCDRYLKTSVDILTKMENFMPYLEYSHVLPGAVDAVAECQLHFPELVKTKKPWRQLVDAVPYV